MGEFITADEIRAKTLVPAISRMTTEQIEDRLIDPAQRIIEEEFNLGLDTDADPEHMVATFNRRPELRTKFRDDMRKCLIFLVDRMAINPHGQSQFSGGGSSISYARNIPVECSSLMRRWGKPRTLYRR